MNLSKSAPIPAVLVGVLAAGLGCGLFGCDGSGPADPDGTSKPYDMIITGGRVVDPETGRDEVAAVGIRNGVIRTVAAGTGVDLPHTDGSVIIDATGLLVAPGFVNTHTHESNAIGFNEVRESSRAFVQDGVTFWLGGNCGLSPTGVRLKFGDVELDTRIGLTLDEYLDETERGGLYNHYGTLSGNISLRGAAGCELGEAETEAQIAEMARELEEEIEAGSFGISYGPFYDPGTTQVAMMELARRSRSSDGMAAIHTREPTFNLWNVLFPGSGQDGPAMILFKESLVEAIEICREAGIPLIVSHLTDMAYNGSTRWNLDAIEWAILNEGLPLAADVIGYDTFMNELFALTRFGEIPVRLLMLFSGVTPGQLWMAEDVFVDGALYMEAYDRFASVEQVEALVAAFAEGRASAGPDSTSMSVKVWCDIVRPESTMLALKRPFVFMGNDGGVSRNPNTGELSVQPRTYACFSRLLGRWSRQEGALSLGEALFKATIAPARWLGLDRKGRIQEGCDADVVIFDPDAVIDRARPEPGMLDLPPEGIAYVIVSGQVVVDHGELTGQMPGEVVRRTWEIPGDTLDVIDLHRQRFPSEGPQAP